MLRAEVAPPTPTAEDVADNALLMYLGSEVEGAGKVIAAALRDAGLLKDPS
jgi:hypothetical protein